MPTGVNGNGMTTGFGSVNGNEITTGFGSVNGNEITTGLSSVNAPRPPLILEGELTLATAKA